MTASDILGEVQSFQAGKGFGLFLQRFDVEFAFGAICDNAMGHAAFADTHGQTPRVDTRQPRNAMTFHPLIKRH